MTTISTCYNAPYTLTYYNIATREDWKESYRAIRKAFRKAADRNDYNSLNYIIYNGKEYFCLGYGEGVYERNPSYNEKYYRWSRAKRAADKRREILGMQWWGEDY